MGILIRDYGLKRGRMQSRQIAISNVDGLSAISSRYQRNRAHPFAVAWGLFLGSNRDKHSPFLAPFATLLVGPDFIQNQAAPKPRLASDAGPSPMSTGCPRFRLDIGEIADKVSASQRPRFWALIAAKDSPFIAPFPTLLLGRVELSEIRRTLRRD